MLRVGLEGTATALGEGLRKFSGIPTQVALAGVESGPAADMLATHDGASVVSVINAPKWDGRLLASADQGFVFTMLEVLLGGDGSEAPYAPDRPFSKIETRVMRIAFEHVATALETAFAPIAESPFSVEGVAARVAFDAIGRSNPVVVAKFRMDALERGGELLVVIPQSVLAPMRRTLSRPAQETAAPPADPVWSQQIHHEVTRATVSLTAVLDERMFPLEDIATLAVGKILPLNATPKSLVRAECNGQPLVTCQLGKSNGVYTLRVEGFVDPEEEYMNDILSG
jgi:flagellar motor switch protein FliM